MLKILLDKDTNASSSCHLNGTIFLRITTSSKINRRTPAARQPGVGLYGEVDSIALEGLPTGASITFAEIHFS